MYCYYVVPRGATATKASKAGPCLNFGLQLTLSQPEGQISIMGHVWLKFAVAPLDYQISRVSGSKSKILD